MLPLSILKTTAISFSRRIRRNGMESIVLFCVLTWLLVNRKFRKEGLKTGKLGLCCILTFLIVILGVFITASVLALSSWEFKSIVLNLGYCCITWLVYLVFSSNAVKDESNPPEEKYKTAIIIVCILIVFFLFLRMYGDYQFALADAYWKARH